MSNNKCQKSGCEFFTTAKYCSVCAKELSNGTSFCSETETESTPVAKEEPKKTRCEMVGCKRKLNMMGVECKCGHVYCSDHRLSFAHNCSVDYNKLAKTKLATDNIRIEFCKITKI